MDIDCPGCGLKRSATIERLGPGCSVHVRGIGAATVVGNFSVVRDVRMRRTYRWLFVGDP